MLKNKLSAKRIKDLVCPPDTAQIFLWDEDTPNHGVRLKPRGRPSFVFQGSFNSKSVRIVIGSPPAWTIRAARDRAREIQVLIDQGIDPRVQIAQTKQASIEAREEQLQVGITVGQAWDEYLARGTAKKGRQWSERYKQSLDSAMHPGGVPHKVGSGVSVPGPLFPLKDLLLKDIDEDCLADWVVDELNRIASRSRAKKTKRPPGYAQVKAAVEWLSGMLRWASNQKQYKAIVHGNAARSSKVQDSLPSKSGARREDFLEVQQLEAFFSAMAQAPNRTMVGYVTGLLLTGARREELAQLRWSDIDFRWKKFKIYDKTMESAERERTMPLAPFFERIVKSMPRVSGNDYVFVSPRSKLGYVQDSRSSLGSTLERAGIKHTTPHGMRRTFSLVGEAAGCPSGAIEQLLGHSVKGMEQHYKPRSIDALRPVLERLENFVIEQAKLPKPTSDGAAT